MKQLTNLTKRPVVLADGTILAAAGTSGASKPVEVLSDTDVRRLGASVHVGDVAIASRVAPAAKKAAPVVEAPVVSNQPEEKK